MKAPLVLIPGLGGTEEMWGYQTEHLSDACTVQAIVLDQQQTLEEMTAHVLATAPERFALAGHSMGGWIAQSVAATAPERITKLTLVNTWARATPYTIDQLTLAKQAIEEGHTEEALEAHVKELVYKPRLEEEQLMNKIRRLQREQPPEVYLRQIDAILTKPEIYPLLQKITAPTLVIHSRQDSVFPFEELEAIAKAIPSSAFTIIEECGHATPVERPQALTALLRLWL